MEVAEAKMLRISLGVMRWDMIRKQYIRGTEHVRCFGEKVRESRLRWFGHEQKRDSEYIGRRMMRLQLRGRKPPFPSCRGQQREPAGETAGVLPGLC